MSLVIFELTPFFKFGYVSVLFLDSLSCSCWTPILILVNAAWWSCLFLLSLQFSLFSPSSLFCPFISFLPISNAKEIYQTPHVPSKKVGVSAPSSFFPPTHLHLQFCSTFLYLFVCVISEFSVFRTIAVLLVAIWLLNFYFSRWLRDCVGLAFGYFYDLHSRIVGSCCTTKPTVARN